MNCIAVGDSRCPACLSKLDGAMDPANGPGPSAGDLSVCFYCSVLLRFNTDLTVRLLRADEYEDLPDALRAQLAMYQAAAYGFMSTQR